MGTPIATAWVKASAVKQGRQSLPAIMAALHRQLREMGQVGLLYDSCILLPHREDPATGIVDSTEPHWKLTAMAENYGQTHL